MKVAVDLHIHTALSPCGDNDMTPNNIANMAFLKGLDIIAITDHNSVKNCEAVINCACKKGIVVVPGMEVETKEEVHVVCLFPTLEEAKKMQEIVYSALPVRENREEIFGQQLVLDDEDNPLEQERRFLITAADISVDDVFSKVEELGGVAIPAHIDRESYSIISNLGMIPDYLNITCVEISKMCSCESFQIQHPYLDRYSFIRSSDAHYLWDILERESFIEVEELSSEGLIRALKKNSYKKIGFI
ncbi:MAG: PHP domain-containing protein [Clostridia bacterium]|nr:PHP domain-containing protein [Clostridia bacterium]